MWHGESAGPVSAGPIAAVCRCAAAAFNLTNNCFLPSLSAGPAPSLIFILTLGDSLPPPPPPPLLLLWSHEAHLQELVLRSKN